MGISVCRRSLLALALAAVVATLALPASAAAGGRFKGYGSCNVYPPGAASFPSDSQCSVGSAWGAVFVAKKEEEVRYRLCVDGPKGYEKCFDKQTHGRGEPSPVLLAAGPEHLGIYRFRWKIKGTDVVKRDKLRLLIGD
jgi:hypothetical protein